MGRRSLALAWLGTWLCGCDVLTGLSDKVFDLPDDGAGGGASAPGCGVAWIETMNSSTDADVLGVAFAADALFVAGNFAVDVTLGGDTLMSLGERDVLAARYGLGGALEWSRAYGDDAEQRAYDVALTSTGDVAIGGDAMGAIVGCSPDGHGYLMSVAAGDPTDTTCENHSQSDVMFSSESAVGDIAPSGQGHIFSLARYQNAVVGQQTLPSQGLVIAKHDELTMEASEAFVIDDFSSSARDIDAADGTVVVVFDSTSIPADLFGAVVQPAPSGDGRHALIAALDYGGLGVWARGLSGDGHQIPRAVAMDAGGGVVVVGSFESQIALGPSDAPTTIDTTLSVGAAWVARFNVAGEPLWLKVFDAASTNDAANAVVIDDDGNAFVTGTIGPDNDDAALLDGGCPADAADLQAFVAMIDPAGELLWIRRFAATASSGHQIALSPDQSQLAVVGRFGGNIDAGGATAASGMAPVNGFLVVMATTPTPATPAMTMR